MPGLGGHRLSNTVLGLAELAWRAGFSVVTISSSMNFEFMLQGSTVALPGHAPTDSLDVHVALDRIHADLVAVDPERFTSVSLLGTSLGAFHTLFIAARESDPDCSLLAFDRYVAISPPVDLFHGMQVLDDLYNAPLALDPEERDGLIDNTLLKVVHLTEREPQPDMVLPFSEVEGDYLIGLAFRLTLAQIIHCSQAREDHGVLQTERGWFRRFSAYREILEYSFLEYFYAFVLPYYQERDPTIHGEQDLLERNDLRFLRSGLAANKRVRVIGSANDFLLRREDKTFLRRTLGVENVTLFPRGGHMGNLHQPPVQKRILEALTNSLHGKLSPRDGP